MFGGESSSHGKIGEFGGEGVALLDEVCSPLPKPLDTAHSRFVLSGGTLRLSCLGEGSALDDGGGVRSIGRDDVIEDVACVRNVVGVADDEELVDVATAGGADVESALSGGVGRRYRP